MDGETFTRNLADRLETLPLPSGLRTELDLERVVRKAVRAFTAESLGIPAAALHDVVYSHGEDPREKALWTKSKALQNVVVYGCSNSGDIFITHPRIGSVYIELKLSKAKGTRGADSLPGDLQRSVGQSVISSLRHPYVICMVVHQGWRDGKPHDLGEKLKASLWERHRIALVVRGVG